LYRTQNPFLKTVQSGLHFTPYHTYSSKHHLNFSRMHSATLQLLC